MITLGVGATEGAGVAGGRVGMLALLAGGPALPGAFVAALLLQAARNAPNPASAVPWRNRRRVRWDRGGCQGRSADSRWLSSISSARTRHESAGALSRTTNVCSGIQDR